LKQTKTNKNKNKITDKTKNVRTTSVQQTYVKWHFEAIISIFSAHVGDAIAPGLDDEVAGEQFFDNNVHAVNGSAAPTATASDRTHSNAGAIFQRI